MCGHDAAGMYRRLDAGKEVNRALATDEDVLESSARAAKITTRIAVYSNETAMYARKSDGGRPVRMWSKKIDTVALAARVLGITPWFADAITEAAEALSPSCLRPVAVVADRQIGLFA